MKSLIKRARFSADGTKTVFLYGDFGLIVHYWHPGWPKIGEPTTIADGMSLAVAMDRLVRGRRA